MRSSLVVNLNLYWSLQCTQTQVQLRCASFHNVAIFIIFPSLLCNLSVCLKSNSRKSFVPISIHCLNSNFKVFLFLLLVKGIQAPQYQITSPPRFHFKFRAIIDTKKNEILNVVVTFFNGWKFKFKFNWKFCFRRVYQWGHFVDCVTRWIKFWTFPLKSFLKVCESLRKFIWKVWKFMWPN